MWSWLTYSCHHECYHDPYLINSVHYLNPISSATNVVWSRYWWQSKPLLFCLVLVCLSWSMISDHLISSIRRLTPFPADAAGSQSRQICQQQLLPTDREPRKPWKMAALFFHHIHWPETGALWSARNKHNHFLFPLLDSYWLFVEVCGPIVIKKN